MNDINLEKPTLNEMAETVGKYLRETNRLKPDYINLTNYEIAEKIFYSHPQGELFKFYEIYSEACSYYGLTSTPKEHYDVGDIVYIKGAKFIYLSDDCWYYCGNFSNTKVWIANEYKTLVLIGSIINDLNNIKVSD